MSDQSTTLDLERESTTAPPVSNRPYVQVGTDAEVIGGARVFLSRSRTQVSKVGAEAPVYLTAQDGNMQQSVPYRAVAAALTQDIIPMAQVVKRYIAAGRGDELAELVSDATAPAPETEEEGA